MSREAIIACLPYLAGIVLSVGALRLLVWVSGARLQLAQLRRLHTDEQGAVQSLSFVLTLPLFVMIMLFIVQLSQLTSARLVVEYAAMAAVRSAVVWIPARLGDAYHPETENRISTRSQIGQMVDENGIPFVVYRIAPSGEKYNKVRLAAVTSVMSVCPSRDTGMALDGDAELAAATILKTYAALSTPVGREHSDPGADLQQARLCVAKHRRSDRGPSPRYRLPPPGQRAAAVLLLVAVA